jgi:hypothetical protein
VPSPPEPIDLRVERLGGAPGARERHPSRPRPRPRVRALLDRWLARTAFLRRRGATTKLASALTDLWDAWAFAELECAIALRAWQLAPRHDKRLPYGAYRRALEREALLAAELGLRSAA